MRPPILWFAYTIHCKEISPASKLPLVGLGSEARNSLFLNKLDALLKAFGFTSSPMTSRAAT